MTPWQQLNPSVWQRVYADGTVGIVHQGVCTNSEAIEMLPDGSIYWPVKGGTDEECKRFLDKKHDPQPELVERGDVWTFYRHGKRGAMAALAHGFWWVYIPLEYSTPYDTREQAEAAARKYVLGAAP